MWFGNTDAVGSSVTNLFWGTYIEPGKQCAPVKVVDPGYTAHEQSCSDQYTYICMCTSSLATPVDGGWSDWSDPGGCSVACGDGTKTLTRICDNPEPQDGGADCQGQDSMQENCNLGPCPGTRHKSKLTFDSTILCSTTGISHFLKLTAHGLTGLTGQPVQWTVGVEPPTDPALVQIRHQQMGAQTVLQAIQAQRR